ncbi:MAG: signal peptidase II, partial [Candidatus Hodarchaeota archaeon]
LEWGETWSPVEWLSPYARIIHWTNKGAAFGLFQSGGLIFTIIAVLVSIAIIYYYPRVPSSNVALRLALALQLGGALGNLTDRLVHGIVTDFISVGSFPVFNIADASISVGSAVLIATMWIEERRLRGKPAEEFASGLGEEDEATEGESLAG